MSVAAKATLNCSEEHLSCPAPDVALEELGASELEATICLLEAEIPANPRAGKNERLESGLRRELERYFRGLAKAFPADEIDRIYYKHVKE